MNEISRYRNGNAEIVLHEDGTRIISFPEDEEIILDYPLNIDIRVSTRCSFGYNPNTQKKGACSFCHESAVTNGIECEYSLLQDKLKDLPKGIELAVGANSITMELIYFINWCNKKGYVVNLTVNSGHTFSAGTKTRLRHLINHNKIKGLGISYRKQFIDRVPKFIREYENTVLHVICGIDSIRDIICLKGWKKLLILGEKDFGFNKGMVDLSTQCHKEWFWWVPKLFNLYEVVSFDNLALQQLKIERLVTPEYWKQFYQHEYSMYINAVDRYFSPSSRDSTITYWENIEIKDYFKSLHFP